MSAVLCAALLLAPAVAKTFDPATYGAQAGGDAAANTRAIQEALYAPNSAEEEHQAELAQGLDAAINADPLAEVVQSGHGTDADAGEYLQEKEGAAERK